MKYILLTFALALTACAPAVVKTDPPVVIALTNGAGNTAGLYANMANMT